MDTTEIIRRLRFRADGEMSAEETKALLTKAADRLEKLMELLTEAADRLEELDERVAIMSENKTGKWERHYDRPGVYADVFWWCNRCGEKSIYNWSNKYRYCPNCGARMEEEDDNTNA